MSRFQTMVGKAKEPFALAGADGKTIDALGYIVYDTAGGALRPLLWADYQAEQAAAAANLAASYGGGYAGRGFVDVVFDVPAAPAPRRADVCTCGGQKYGGGTCSSWCDSSAARAQHAVGGEP